MNRSRKKPALHSQLFLETHTGNGVLFDKHDKERRRILIVIRRKAKLAKRPYTTGGRSGKRGLSTGLSKHEYSEERRSYHQSKNPEEEDALLEWTSSCAKTTAAGSGHAKLQRIARGLEPAPAKRERETRRSHPEQQSTTPPKGPGGGVSKGDSTWKTQHPWILSLKVPAPAAPRAKRGGQRRAITLYLVTALPGIHTAPQAPFSASQLVRTSALRRKPPEHGLRVGHAAAMGFRSPVLSRLLHLVDVAPPVV